MSASRAEIETAIRLRMDPQATIHDMNDQGGYGVVRWSRPCHYIPGGREHIVHRWAMVDTDGQPIVPTMFFSGDYYDTEASAQHDYNHRRP